MFMWVAAEADGTRRTMLFLVSCLLGISVLLTGLTIWYWLMTRPDDDDESGDDAVDDLPEPDGRNEIESSSIDADRRPPQTFDFITLPDGPSRLPDGPTQLPDPPKMPPTPAAPMRPPTPEPAGVSSADVDPPQVDLVAADAELVSGSEGGSQELSDDGWDALRRSVLNKFQR